MFISEYNGRTKVITVFVKALQIKVSNATDCTGVPHACDGCM